MKFIFSEICQVNYPNISLGVLAMGGIENIKESATLEGEKATLATWLGARYASREAIKADETLGSYAAYYKRFKKNYHVFFQVESVAVKGKPIPRVNALVEAMFMAELRHGLLTAGHDLGMVRGTVTLDCATGAENYETMSGEEKTLKAGDMYVRDEAGVLSSIIYGPDKRTQITEETREALFTTYAVDGITREAVRTQMEDIARWVRLFSPQAEIRLMDVYPNDQ